MGLVNVITRPCIYMGDYTKKYMENPNSRGHGHQACYDANWTAIHVVKIGQL